MVDFMPATAAVPSPSTVGLMPAAVPSPSTDVDLMPAAEPSPRTVNLRPKTEAVGLPSTSTVDLMPATEAEPSPSTVDLMPAAGPSTTTVDLMPAAEPSPSTVDLMHAADPSTTTVDLMDAIKAETSMSTVDLMPATEAVPSTIKDKRRRKKAVGITSTSTVDLTPATEAAPSTSTLDLTPATEAAPSTKRAKRRRKKVNSSSVWKCVFCDKHYSNKYCLRTHTKKCIRDVENLSVSVSSEDCSWPGSNIPSLASPEKVKTIVRVKPGRKRADSSSEWTCARCNKHFINKYCLMKHNKRCIRNVTSLYSSNEVNTNIRVKPSRKASDSSSAWNCAHCNKHYSDKYCLAKHIKKCIEKVENATVGVTSVKCSPSNIAGLHSSNKVNTIFRKPRIRSVQSRRHSCLICQKSFANKRDIVYHIKSYHPSIDVDTLCPPMFRKVVQCPVCLVKTKTRIALFDHIQESHAEEETPGVLFFNTAAEFQTWKRDEETRTVSIFVKKCGSRNENFEDYYCRRSGTFRSRGIHKRRIKIQGSCKVGSKCPAYISATITPKGVMVMYSSEHNGHDKDLKHFTLSQIERQRIAGMISAGIQFDDILDSVRDNLSPTEVTRLHLLKRTDLTNISRDFYLNKVRSRVRKARNRVRKHNPTIVQQCGVEAVASYTQTWDQGHDMNFAVPQSVNYFDRATELVPQANATLGAGETDMLKAKRAASNDKERNLKEIEKLINTIRDSLVGDLRQDVTSIAKETLKAAAAQITAASFRPPVQPGTLPPSQSVNEPVKRKQDKQVRKARNAKQVGNSRNAKRNRQPIESPSASEMLTIARAQEGQELFVSCVTAQEVHGYEMDDQQQFQHYYRL